LSFRKDNIGSLAAPSEGALPHRQIPDHLISLNSRLLVASAHKRSPFEIFVRRKMLRLPTLPALSISPEKAYFIAAKARQFDAKDGVTDPESGSNASDDGMRSVLEDRTDDPVLAELTSFIHDLNDDEQIDLVALTWLGRGDGDIENWDELRAEAARAHNKRTAAYLLGKPMLADHLEEALSKFGHSSEEVEADLF
jgi:hypothetical protein